MTATRIIFSGDVALVVSGDLDDVQGGIYEALANGGWMVVRPDDGPSVSINPQQILYMEEFNRMEEEASSRPWGRQQQAAGAH